MRTSRIYFIWNVLSVCVQTIVYMVLRPFGILRHRKTGQALWGCSRIGEGKDGFIEITIGRVSVFATDGWQI
jgi:hypothetical protein